MTKKYVERFGPAARCPACADTTKRISRRDVHNDECRDRVGKLFMDEGAQRVKVTSRGHEFEKRPAQEEQQRVQDPRQS